MLNSIDAMSSDALPALPRRLDAILAAAGITGARVATINGAPATASQLVYPGEEVKVDGATIERKERPTRVHVYHKLAGEKIDLVPLLDQRIVRVGDDGQDVIDRLKSVEPT